MTTIANSAGETVNIGRDANDDAISVSIVSSSGATTYSHSRAFDELGRIIQSIGAGTQTYGFGYDRTDNLTSVADPRSNVFSYGFDPLNRLIKETDESGAVANLTRDGQDNITAYQDPRGNTTTYVRNGFGEIIQEASPDRGITVYTRDPRGLVISRTDARGIVTNFQYDAAGRLVYKSYAGQTQYWQSFAWDDPSAGKGIGRLAGLYSESGMTWRSFDAQGRVWVEYRTNNPAPAVGVFYNYDAAGNITEIDYPSGRRVFYARDAMGRVAGVTTYENSSAAAQTIASNVVWNPYGPLSNFTLGNNLTTIFTTDANYLVTRVQTGWSGAPGSLLDRSFAWVGDTVTDIVDNQNPGTSPPFTWSAQTQSFTYTPTRRLASASGYYGAYAWTYDANGNRLTETANGAASSYLYPLGSNQLQSVASVAGTRGFTYDPAGDLLTDTRAGALGMRFTYDVEGRLASANQTSAPAIGGTYAYDALGRLASRTYNAGSGATTLLYIHDINNHIIAETNTAGQTLREYIWLNDFPVAVVDKVNTATPSIYFVHTDHFGRPARMTDAASNWVWDVIYAPFGAVSYIWTNPENIDLRFPGQWFQLETGLAYNWHRHYDATLGRYLQPDPLRLRELEGQAIGEVMPLLTASQSALSGQIYSHSGAEGFGVATGVTSAWSLKGADLPDAPSLYGYSRQNPLAWIDPKGLMSSGWPTSPKIFHGDANISRCVAQKHENCSLAFNACHFDGFDVDLCYKSYEVCAGNPGVPVFFPGGHYVDP